MKKLFIMLLIALLILPAQMCFAGALETQWLRVESKNAYILRTPTNSVDERLFLAEYTYYLRVIGQTNLYYQVVLYDSFDGFYSISGYIRKDEVVLCSDSPTLPLYPKVTATVNVTSCMLYADRDPTSEVLMYALRNQEVYYYGAYENYLFCRLGDKLGYILTECLIMPDIALHPKPLPVPSITTSGNNPSPTVSTPAVVEAEPLSPLSILLPVAVVTAVLVLVLFMDRRKKRKSA